MVSWNDNAGDSREIFRLRAGADGRALLLGITQTRASCTQQTSDPRQSGPFKASSLTPSPPPLSLRRPQTAPRLGSVMAPPSAELDALAGVLKRLRGVVPRLVDAAGDAASFPAVAAEASLLALELKAANRDALESVEASREATARARAELDDARRRLQSATYERGHVQGEIEASRAFRSAVADEDVALCAIEAFERARPDAASLDAHEKTLERLRHELAEREALREREKRLEVRDDERRPPDPTRPDPTRAVMGRKDDDAQKKIAPRASRRAPTVAPRPLLEPSPRRVARNASGTAPPRAAGSSTDSGPACDASSARRRRFARRSTPRPRAKIDAAATTTRGAPRARAKRARSSPPGKGKGKRKKGTPRRVLQIGTRVRSGRPRRGTRTARRRRRTRSGAAEGEGGGAGE